MPNRSGHDERLLGRVIGQKKIVIGEQVVSDSQMQATAVSVLGRIRSEVGKGEREEGKTDRDGTALIRFLSAATA